MNPPMDVEELLRYAAGESPAGEASRVEAWCRASDDNAALLDALRHGGLADLDGVRVDVARAMERLRGRLGGTDTPVRASASSEDGIGRRHPQSWRVDAGWTVRRRSVWRIAGALISAVAILAVVVSALRHAPRRTSSMMVYTTGNGQRATITLPDGGVASLNVASRLEVPLDYATGDRTVRLTGEAIFTVPHHGSVPFMVLTGGAPIRVLGTSFVVRCYTSDTAELVAVNEGKVAVKSTVVSARQMVTVGQGGVSPIRRVDGSIFSFARGVLTINGVPLSQAIVDLDRWYDADIRLGDPELATQPLVGEFAAGSLADLATLLRLTYNVRVVRDGRVLTLYVR